MGPQAASATTTPLFQLWQYGTKICCLTPANQRPPYLVVIYVHGERSTERSFTDHDDATAFAVDELRRAITQTIEPA